MILTPGMMLLTQLNSVKGTFVVNNSEASTPAFLPLCVTHVELENETLWFDRQSAL